MKAIIVYASLTGNTEVAANFLANCLRSLEIQVDIYECQQINPSTFLEADICIVASYTYGSAGNLPEEIHGFYDDLKSVNLKGKIYASIGTGEEDYGYFCKSADDFAQQFDNTGAISGGKILKIEGEPDIESKKELAKLAKEIVQSYQLLNK
ncbi:MAG: flavodoxin [Brumimicrobium sp.]|nr:flavodoxin [Brumimicrobium sp.]